MDQLSFASLDYAAKKKRTKRDVFWLRWQPWCLGSRSKLRSGRIIPRLVRAAVGDHSQGGSYRWRRSRPFWTITRVSRCLSRRPSNRAADAAGASPLAEPYLIKRRPSGKHP
jgi:hypothetical protein